MITIYGIKSCDTMKKAFTWLDDQGVEYQFHDYKKAGIDEASLRRWLEQRPWDELVNRRGTTWRKLPQEQRDNMDTDAAVAAMMDNPSLIKRPVLEREGTIHLGFKADEYAALFENA